MISKKQKQVIICSTRNAINKSKIYGSLDLCSINLYQILVEQLSFVKNITGREDIFKNIQTNILNYQYTSDDITTDVKAVLPDESYFINENDDLITTDISESTNNTAPIISNYTTTTIIQETLFGSGTLLDTYKFTISDFINVYSDNNDDDFHSIIIHRDNLNGMNLKYNSTPTTGNVFGENISSITINKNDISNWSLYTSSDSIFSHDIQFQIVDLQNEILVPSNIATLTVNRAASINQPATIGDNTIIVDNRTILTFTLNMFTDNLSPPYNDPENDLIDAIRIDEISTANLGQFKLNNIDLIEGDIISREDIEGGLFTYESPNRDDIYSDSFNFSARDEGSQIWVF